MNKPAKNACREQGDSAPFDTVFFENLPQAAVILDSCARITYANRGARTLLGPRSGYVGLNASDFLPVGYSDKKFREVLADCISEDGRTHGMALPALRQDGSLFKMEVRLSAVAESGTWYLLALLEDDSVRRRRDKELAGALATAGEIRQARNILDTISESFCIVDAGWIIRYWNRAAEKATGKGSNVVLGRHMWEVFPQKEKSKLFEMCDRSMNERVTTRFEHSSGADTCFYNAVHPNEDGGITIYFKNISVRKNKEREREMLVKELTKNNSDLLQFSFITSHNLRAPLSNILGLVRLLDRDTMDSEARLIAGMISQSAEKLSDTINDLSEMLVIKNSPATKTELVSISEVFAKVRKSFLDAGNGIDCDVRLEMAAASVSFSERYLENIFVNLVSNAIKYRDGSRRLEIAVRSFHSLGSTFIEFSDNGTGIDMDRHGKRLFGMYQRFHSLAEGQGLGLFIVKSQVDSLGGTIEASSKVGCGTTFRMAFPDGIGAS